MLHTIHYIICDFDGVFTDNYVWTDSFGNESVKTSRTDSLGISNFNKVIEFHKLNCRIIIVSTERNEVVTRRADKLRIESHTGVENKQNYILKEILKGDYSKWTSTVYLGNDTNDIEAATSSLYSFAPRDAHPTFKARVSKVMDSAGGNGFVRETLEYLISQTDFGGI